MKYSVNYSDGNEFKLKYVGSIQDYKDGGMCDPIMMEKEEAEELLNDLNEHVCEEYIGSNDDENELAHNAFERGEWGFWIEEWEGETELTYDVWFQNNEASNNKGFINASREECLDYIRQYNGTNESYFEDYKGGYVQVVCIETEEVVYEEHIPAAESKGINSMDDLAGYINAADEWPSDVEDIIERNGWVSDTGTEFGICHDDTRRVVVNERGIAEVLDV